MSIHIQEVLDYLDIHPARNYGESAGSLMEMLHEVYTMYNDIDSKEIRDKFAALQPVFEGLPAGEADALFSTICDLCMEHEQLAFSHGVAVGLLLMCEVNMLT